MSDCGCTRPTRAGYTICDTCKSDLEQHLAEIPWLDGELDVSLTRAKGVDYNRISVRGTDKPLPWNERASRARHELKAELVSWFRVLWRKGEPIPDDTLIDIAAWLQLRLNDIAKRDDAWTIWDQITRASLFARSVVFAKPEKRTFIGPCEGRLSDNDEPTETACEGEIFQIGDSAVSECDVCLRAYDTDAATRVRDQRIKDRGIMLTASQIAKFAHRGLGQPQEKVVRLIDSWRRKGQIVAKGEHRCSDDGDFCTIVTDKETQEPRCLLRGKPAYAYSDALDMLLEAYGDAS